MQSRSVIEVANQILNIIPHTEHLLKDEINQLCIGFANQAPEVLCGSYCWTPFINILNKHIQEFDIEWKIVAQNIVNNLNG
jgi:hypothetical protein